MLTGHESTNGSAGTQQQNGSQMQRSLSNAMPNLQQADEQPVMADVQQEQLGMPRNNFPPYINPYQSFPNPGTMQVTIEAILGDTQVNIGSDCHCLQGMILRMHTNYVHEMRERISS